MIRQITDSTEYSDAISVLPLRKIPHSLDSNSLNAQRYLTMLIFEFFVSVLSVYSSVIKFNEYLTDAGNNISIPCLARGSVMWVKEECNETTKEFVVWPNHVFMFYEISCFCNVLNVMFFSSAVRTCVSTIFNQVILEHTFVLWARLNQI